MVNLTPISDEDVPEVVRILAQVRATGILNVRQADRLTELGLNMWSYLRSPANVSLEYVRHAIAKGRVSQRTVERILTRNHPIYATLWDQACERVTSPTIHGEQLRLF